MRIAYLSEEYPHELISKKCGGIGTSIKNLASAIAELGHDVTVFVVNATSHSEFADGRVKIVTIAPRRFKWLNLYQNRRGYAKVINGFDYDVIEVPDWFGLSAFMNLNNKVVKFHGSHTYFSSLEGVKPNRTVQFLERYSCKKADAYIGVSRFALEKSFETLGLSGNKPKAVIYNGINTDYFSSFAQGSATPDIKNVILYFGTLVRKKGCLEIPHIFNEIVRLFPDAKLWLVGGDAPDSKSNRSSTWKIMESSFSEDAKKNVTYFGKCHYEQVKEYIANASVCIFPSYAEAFPVSWLEAMSMEKAVVTSDIGWAPELIENGVSGILVDPAKHTDFAAAVVGLLKDDEKRNQLGHLARNRILAQFSIRTIAQQHIDFYQSVADKTAQ